VPLEVLARLGRSSLPDEAEVAVPGADGVTRARVRRRAGTVNVELPVAEAIRPAALVELDELGAENARVEAVRALPVRDGDDDVVEVEAQDVTLLAGALHRLVAGRHSHSIVAGGFDEMSSATRFTPGISLMMRDEIVSSRS
jgi:hypothetical protein